MTNCANKAKTGYQVAYDTAYWLKERIKEGYYWTQYNVIWHWMDWCQNDSKAWKSFPKVFKLCDKKSASKGAGKMIKRRILQFLK